VQRFRSGGGRHASEPCTGIRTPQGRRPATQWSRTGRPSGIANPLWDSEDTPRPSSRVRSLARASFVAVGDSHIFE
jgi:hypothetical protein